VPKPASRALGVRLMSVSVKSQIGQWQTSEVIVRATLTCPEQVLELEVAALTRFQARLMCTK
jgi:hypothetical protein